MSLGNLIYKVRKSQKLSREALSSGICSAKQIYLIERGERNPSISLMRKLGEKLGVDFFEMMQYADYEDPLLVKEILDRFEDCRNEMDCGLLAAETELAASLPDFVKSELKMELMFNRLYHDVFMDTDVSDRLDECMEIHGAKIPVYANPTHHNSITVLRLANLKAVYHMKHEDYDQGLKIFEWLHPQMSRLKIVTKHKRHYVSVTLNYTRALLMSGFFSQGILVAEELLGYQFDTGQLDRTFMTLHYLTQGNMLTGEEEMALHHFRRMIFSGAHLTNSRHFKQMLSEPIARQLFARLDPTGLIQQEIDKL